MIFRDLSQTLLKYANFPAIALLGPRQSGKTTLARSVFKDHLYVSLEHQKTRELVKSDPERFLQLHENEVGIIFDEFQHIPELLSYLQIAIDEKNRPGYFVLTGSQNFLMNQAITQSLAGRVGILTLLPLSLHELKTHGLLEKNAEALILKGFYPRLYNEKIDPEELYASYLQTYVERDVRQLANVGDLAAFEKFIRLCAGRIGQLLNVSDLATVCGISSPTAQRWLSILEASYIIFRLQPYFNNFNKRLTQASKIYFYDTGLACSLLGIDTVQQLGFNRLYGNIFENFIMADLCKQYFNGGKRPPLYFWRDKNGRIEVDCIIAAGQMLVPVEIKSGATVAVDFYAGLKKWRELVVADKTIELGRAYVVYGGDKTLMHDELATVSWKDVGDLMKGVV